MSYLDNVMNVIFAGKCNPPHPTFIKWQIYPIFLWRLRFGATKSEKNVVYRECYKNILDVMIFCNETLWKYLILHVPVWIFLLHYENFIKKNSLMLWSQKYGEYQPFYESWMWRVRFGATKNDVYWECYEHILDDMIFCNETLWKYLILHVPVWFFFIFLLHYEKFIQKFILMLWSQKYGVVCCCFCGFKAQQCLGQRYGLKTLSSQSLVSGFKCKLRDSNSRPPYSRPHALTTILGYICCIMNVRCGGKLKDSTSRPA